jgi:competence protein ComEC
MITQNLSQIRNELKTLFLFLTVKCPLLVCALPLLFGIFFAFHNLYALIPTTLYFIFLPKQWFFPCVLFFLSPLPYLQHAYQFPSEKINGKGEFLLSQIEHYQGRGWLCRGTVLSFESKAKKVPTSIFLPYPPPKGRKWEVKGELTPSRFPYYQLKKCSILCSKKTFSLPYLRQKCKHAFSKMIDQHYQDPLANAFVKALFLGQKEGKQLTFYLRQCGLSHLAAISGFHFALIAFFLYYTLGFFLPSKKRALFLLITLTLYYLFIGPAPSIQRAWIFSLLALGGVILDREIHVLNLLGGAMLFSLCLDPLCVLSLSFQLTFLATATLFLYVKPMENLLSKIWKFPKAQKLYQLPLDQQMIFLFFHFLNAQLVVNLAINTVLIPYLLFQFHHFPLISICLNLIYPTLSAVTLFLFLLGTIFTPLSFLAVNIHAFNHWITSTYLHPFDAQLIHNYEIYLSGFPTLIFIFYLVFWAFFGVLFTTIKERVILKLCYH